MNDSSDEFQTITSEYFPEITDKERDDLPEYLDLKNYENVNKTPKGRLTLLLSILLDASQKETLPFSEYKEHITKIRDASEKLQTILREAPKECLHSITELSYNDPENIGKCEIIYDYNPDIHKGGACLEFPSMEWSEFINAFVEFKGGIYPTHLLLTASGALNSITNSILEQKYKSGNIRSKKDPSLKTNIIHALYFLWKNIKGSSPNTSIKKGKFIPFVYDSFLIIEAESQETQRTQLESIKSVVKNIKKKEDETLIDLDDMLNMAHHPYSCE